jgi:hypothetical protein
LSRADSNVPNEKQQPNLPDYRERLRTFLIFIFSRSKKNQIIEIPKKKNLFLEES